MIMTVVPYIMDVVHLCCVYDKYKHLAINGTVGLAAWHASLISSIAIIH